MKTLLTVITLFLFSCTKQTLEDNKINDYSSLEVVQAKGITTIHFTSEPKPYIRIVDVRCVYGSNEIGTVMFISANETEVTTSYSVNAQLTSYYLATFSRYHE